MTFYGQIIELKNNPLCVRQRLLRYLKNQIEWDLLTNDEENETVIHKKYFDFPGFSDLSMEQKCNLLKWAGEILRVQGFTVEGDDDMLGILKISWKVN